MAIRKATVEDLSKLVELFKSFFTMHNRFQQSYDEIVSYLKETMENNDLLISDDYSAALFLVNFGQNADVTHKLWKFRHFAFKSEDVAKELLTAAEEEVSKEGTAKIELTVAETEEGIGFYKAQGYELEGTLKNHYRWGETCFILSKSFSN